MSTPTVGHLQQKMVKSPTLVIFLLVVSLAACLLKYQSVDVI